MKKIIALACIAISTIKAVESPVKPQQISNTSSSTIVKQPLQEPNNILATKAPSRKKTNVAQRAKPHLRQKAVRSEVKQNSHKSFWIGVGCFAGGLLTGFYAMLGLIHYVFKDFRIF